MRFAVVIEKGENNYSAYVPDLPGCVTTGKTIKAIKQMMKEAIEFHIEGMMLDDEAIPEPTSECCSIDVEMPKIDKPARRKSRATTG